MPDTMIAEANPTVKGTCLSKDQFEDVEFHVANAALRDARDFDVHSELSVNDMAVVAIHNALVAVVHGDFTQLSESQCKALVAYYVWKLGICLLGMGR